MHRSTRTRFAPLLAMMLVVASAHSGQPPADKAIDAVSQFLADLKVTDSRAAALQELDETVLGEIFPTGRFFLLRFRQYPVARIAPEPLQFNNLLLVSDDLKVKLITSSDTLLELFKGASAAAPTKIATAWALLEKELVDDGMFHLEAHPEKITIQQQAPGKVVVIPVEPAKGGSNRGRLTLYLTFDAAGQVVAQRSENELVRGPRPICQSMLLNDADAEVRAAAERVLLLMGCDALPYLRERLEVVDPALGVKIRSVVDKIEASTWSQ